MKVFKIDRWKDAWKPNSSTSLGLRVWFLFAWTLLGGWAGVGVLVLGLTLQRTPSESRVPERAQEMGGNHCRQSAVCWVAERWVLEAGRGGGVVGRRKPRSSGAAPSSV